MPCNRLRDNKYSITKVNIGNGTYINRSKIDDYVYIGCYCSINYAYIGRYSCIADGVQIGGMEHAYWDYSISPHISADFIFGKITTIGHDVWIAAGCIIKQGVTIGDGAVIGANSFVTKDVPPYAIVFGTPAQIHKYRFDESLITDIQESGYWKHSPKKAKDILNELRKQKHE